MPVYFVQGGESGLIKIGFARNVASRLVKMRVDSPVPLALMIAIEGDLTIERELHQRFSDDRVSGEWFRPSEPLLSFIRTATPLELPNKARKPFNRPSGRVWRVSEIVACAGGLQKLAHIVGIEHPAVCGWKRRDRVPYMRAIPISKALGIPLHEIRPDIWPPKDAA